MSNAINTNVQAIIARNAMTINNRAMSQAMQQLSTGQRINSAKDDAAGLAVSQSMTAQIRGLNQAVRNANDGVSLAQTAEGAMVEISNMLQRMRELAIQAASSTVNTSQKSYLDTEYQQLSLQIQNTVSNTKWNGFSVLNGATAGATFAIQVGADSGSQTITVTSAGLSIADYTGTAVSSVASASAAISALDSGLNSVNSARATLGAMVSRLTSTTDNLTVISQNLSESRSRILDTDYAAATTELARTQIIREASTAVLAQANQMPQTVLALLK